MRVGMRADFDDIAISERDQFLGGQGAACRIVRGCVLDLIAERLPKPHAVPKSGARTDEAMNVVVQFVSLAR